MMLVLYVVFYVTSANTHSSCVNHEATVKDLVWIHKNRALGLQTGFSQILSPPERTMKFENKIISICQSPPYALGHLASFAAVCSNWEQNLTDLWSQKRHVSYFLCRGHYLVDITTFTPLLQYTHTHGRTDLGTHNTLFPNPWLSFLIRSPVSVGAFFV